jgi:hypothetical protein
VTREPRAWIVAAAVVFVLAGCGSTAHPMVAPATTTAASLSTTTVMAPNYGAIYLRIVAPYNRAVDNFSRQAKALPADATETQLSGLISPLIAATITFNREALAVAWPTNVRADIRTLVTDDGAVMGDLESLNSTDPSTVSQALAAWSRDSSTADNAAAIVRADLGLPSNLKS